jgi:hypothetical protein
LAFAYRNPGAIVEPVCRDVMDCQLRIISTEATPSLIVISDYSGTLATAYENASAIARKIFSRIRLNESVLQAPGDRRRDRSDASVEGDVKSTRARKHLWL